MGIFDKIVQFARTDHGDFTRMQSDAPVQQAQPVQTYSSGGSADYGVDRTRGLRVYRMFCEVSSLYRCASLIANDVAGLPVRVVRHRGAGPPAVGSKAENFHRLMNYGMLDGDTPYTFVRDLVMDLLLYGNCYIFPLRRSGRVVDLVRLPAYGVEVHREPRNAPVNPGMKYYYVTQHEEKHALPEKHKLTHDQVVHTRLASLDDEKPDEGTPVVPIRISDVAIAHVSDARVRDMLRRGNLQQIAMVADPMRQMTEAQINGLKAWFGTQPSERPLVSDLAQDWKMLSPTPQSADMARVREMADERIAMRFGIPAPLIGRNVTQWGQGISELNRLYLRGSVKHAVTNIAASMTHAFVEASVYYVKFDLRELLRGDYKTMSEINSAAAGPNHESWITSNEARADEDRDPIPGGDELIESSVPNAPMQGVGNDDRDDE